MESRNVFQSISGVKPALPINFFRHYFAVRNLSACASLLLFLSLGATPLSAQSHVQSVTFKIPPTKIPLKVKDDDINIIASANIVLRQQSKGLNILTLDLTADLSDLQQHMTDLLSSQLDKDDRCGDRIEIQNATLAPAEPAALAVVQLHYERYGCAKVFGKQQSKRFVGGNAIIPMTLTPAVEEDHTELRLVPTVGQIQADGSLGELLRSGTLGEMLQEKIHKAILNAMQEGTDLAATLPPAVQGYATVENAQFKDAGSGRLLVLLSGKIQITNDQIQALSKQVKERAASAAQ